MATWHADSLLKHPGEAAPGEPRSAVDFFGKDSGCAQVLPGPGSAGAAEPQARRQAALRGTG